MPTRSSRKKKAAPVCPRCTAEHFSVLGFTFPGEEQLEALILLLQSHPEFIDRLEQDRWAN